MTEPDFSKKPPVLPLTPEEEAEAVLAAARLQARAGADRSRHRGAGADCLRRQRPHVRPRAARLHADADAGGELDPVGRISVHEDKDGDGKYETHKVFVDNMVFPRFVMPFGANAILAKESNADELWKYTDTDGDGIADKKELFATGMGRLANVEHQESGLFWAMDNWIYSTINSVRLRWTPTGVLREPTGSNGGQWGVTQDNYGKVWFQAGASGMPGYFQFPVAYGNFTYPEQFEPDLNITWGAPVLIADMQGGMNAVRMPDGSLARATGAAGNDVFRGDRLPKDMIGDYFYGEVGRAHRPPAAPGEERRPDAAAERLPAVGVHPLDRPAVPSGRHDHRAGRDDVHHRHVSRHHPGVAVVGPRHLPAAAHRSVRRSTRWSKHGRIWRLTYDGMRAPHRRAEDADRDAGAARRAPERSERLVARHGAAADRPQAGQVGRAGAEADGARRRRTSWRASTRCGRSTAWRRPTRRCSAS